MAVPGLRGQRVTRASGRPKRWLQADAGADKVKISLGPMRRGKVESHVAALSKVYRPIHSPDDLEVEVERSRWRSWPAGKPNQRWGRNPHGMTEQKAKEAGIR